MCNFGMFCEKKKKNRKRTIGVALGVIFNHRAKAVVSMFAFRFISIKTCRICVNVVCTTSARDLVPLQISVQLRSMLARRYGFARSRDPIAANASHSAIPRGEGSNRFPRTRLA